MGILRTKMEQNLRARGLTEKTSQHYLRVLEAVTRHYGRAPDTLTVEDIEAYLIHLREVRQLAWASLAPVVCALRFFYYVTLRRPRADFPIPAPPPSRKLPHVLNRPEVARLLVHTPHRRNRMLLTTTYAAGLRVSEVVALRIADLDSARNVMRIEQGKGRADRYALLTERLLTELRTYWRVARPEPWLFPNSPRNEHHVSIRTASRVFGAAKARAGITKPGGIHSLRHAFATHLVEDGTNLDTVRRLLGHQHLETTSRYLHLAPTALARAGSRCDLLTSAKIPPLE